MALIYRYEIVNSNIRESIDLKKYENNILSTIENEFRDSLKDCFVSERYYEFKLFKSLTNDEKREFGKTLLIECPTLKNDIDELRERDSSGYFKRMKQRLYAYILEDDIELIDAMDFQNIEAMRNKSQSYLASLDINLETRELSDNLQLLFYMDTYTLSGESNKYLELIEKIHRYSGESDFQSNFFLLEGYSHSQEYSYDDKLVIMNDDNPRVNYSEVTEGFTITEIFKQNKEEIESLEEQLSIFLQYKNDFELENNNLEEINFNVFNTGQALCTCVDTIKESPILFFDFGLSNEIKVHKTIDKYIKSNPPIIISHLHRDHWNGVNVFTDAYRCNWYIPEQDLKVQFKKKCAQILFMNGNVEYIKNHDCLNLNFGKLSSFSTGVSSSSHFHETGLVLNLELIDENANKRNILVPGDQRYLNINTKYLSNVDILVASHHGGEYYKTKSKSSLKHIPLAKENSLIIYSANNTKPYFHPSHKSDYRKRNWLNEHVTYIDGDYRFKQ